MKYLDKSKLEVIKRVAFQHSYFETSEDEALQYPLVAENRPYDFGYGIYCSKGMWVTSCEPSVANEVLSVVNSQHFNPSDYMD